jgi:hemerythrin-like domain-containing protein
MNQQQALTPQVTLPGQAHTAEGPYDQTGMYLMHHAFRRDLDRFVSAIRNTPVGDTETWTALTRRWDRFDTILHHHHTIEDEAIWPVLMAHADAAGRADDRATLEAMEAEHGAIDPALQAMRTSFAAMNDHPCTDHRNALDIRVTALREALVQHLHHEETEALPLVQATMTPQEWKAAESAAAKGYPPKLLPFLINWVAYDVPQDVLAKVVHDAGRAYTVLYRLTRRRFTTIDQKAFRYA